MVSRRTHRTIFAADAPFLPTIGLNLSVHECSKVTWIGIREILSRNTKVITKIKSAELQQPVEQPTRSPKIATDVSQFSSRSSEALTPSRPADPHAHETHEDAYLTEITAIYIGLNRYRLMIQEHTDHVLRGNFLQHKGWSTSGLSPSLQRRRLAQVAWIVGVGGEGRAKRRGWFDFDSQC